MERTPVQSTNIKSIGFKADFEESNGVLEIEFNNGGVYQYEDVPADVYTELMNSGSVGSYFHKHIRPHWTGRKL